jgi:quercetin dioxygenase-like cupin family protein
MIVKKLQDVPFSDMPDHKGVKNQIVLGPADGSDEIILRHFSVGVGENSPHHAHAFPHLVRIEAGSGELVDEKGRIQFSFQSIQSVKSGSGKSFYR